MLGTSDIKLRSDMYFSLHFFFLHFFIKYAHWQCWRKVSYLILLKSIIWPCCSKLSADRTIRWPPDQVIFSLRTEITAVNRQVQKHQRDRTTGHQHRHWCGSQTSHKLFFWFSVHHRKRDIFRGESNRRKFGSCWQGALHKGDQEKRGAGKPVPAADG